MKKVAFIIQILIVVTIVNVYGQASTLTLKQQNDDFAIFKDGLKEGHSGLYYFVSESTFKKNCDSIQTTFKDGLSIEDYYLKLRYLITSLNHGHTRIALPTTGNLNYRMAVLDTTKLYLPFEFLIINKQLLIKEDCSNEQLFPKYAIVKSINNISAKELLKQMALYIPADVVNQTFKYYTLYNYFYFNYLFNLFYPNKQGVKIELLKNKTHYYIKLLQAKAIDSNYTVKNNKSISLYEKQLEYKPNLPNQTAYLKISSFYKGLIENFAQKYESFLDSTFTDLKLKKTQNLILDLRNNEGGGDSYDFLLLSYLINQTMLPDKVTVAGKKFSYLKFGKDLSDDFKAFVENPNAFLQDDTTLQLKEAFTGQSISAVQKTCFEGSIIVLTNGGTFSAATNVLKRLYNYKKISKHKIVFVGEENGGDIYSNTECAGQGYSIMLPNSLINVDMPLLCFGELKIEYPKKRLPDHVVYQTIADLKNNNDRVLNFALLLCGNQ
jgi:hypothetical protein